MPGSQVRPRFIYDLPKDFPFNEVCIQKSISGSGNQSGGNESQSGNKNAPDRRPIPDQDYSSNIINSSNGLTSSQKTVSNHDVDPQEVLRTFTNSLHSGGTLGAIHSSLTYYKEALASKEWSNLSPSNAYQNYMYRKNLVSEIQRLAKELNKIPTEEAIKLADQSRSKISYDIRNSNSINLNSIIGEPERFAMGMIGNNESSVLMDLNRASIIKA
jgi:hypothetical protein